MIRQAQTYFVGAMSGTVLIGAAIAVFVVLVSAQVFHDWPVSSLGSSGSAKTQVSDATSATHALGASPAASSIAAAQANARATAVSGTTSHAKDVSSAGVADLAERTVAKPETSSGAENPLSTAGEPASSPPGSSDSGSHRGAPAHPTSPAPASPSPPPASGGSGGGGEKPTGGGGGGEPTPAPTSTSKAVTESVNKTVTGAAETATGGAAGETGVTGVTEEAVNGVAGPESVVGQTVDEAGGAVGGLLGAGK